MVILLIVISLILVGSSLSVISTPNPVYAVLWLVISFINAAILFISIGVDYIGLIYIVVYVGAIAILFLFIIMLIQVPSDPRIKDNSHFLFISIVIVWMLSCMLVTRGPGFFSPCLSSVSISDSINHASNVTLIGRDLYTSYSDLLIIASLILLVAMVGAILLSKPSQLTPKEAQ